MSSPVANPATSTSQSSLSNMPSERYLVGPSSIEGIVPPLEPTPEAIIDLLTTAQTKMMGLKQAPIKTDHVLHAGMYSRTITMPPGTPLVGALIKIPTLVITVGDGWVYVNGQWKEVRGYNVIPGCPGRKQAFYSVGALVITMVFPTAAKTIEDAEKDFTDEAALLLSRRQPEQNSLVIGEQV